MKLTDNRSGLKITKSKRFCAIKGGTYDSFNRRTVANIRRTEHAVMDCPQWKQYKMKKILPTVVLGPINFGFVVRC